MQLIIQVDGSIRCLYDEVLDINCLGQIALSRGSHVEPDASGNWFADLAPVFGPRIGPLPQRSMALTAERAWLEKHWLLRSPASTNSEEETCDTVPII